MDPVVGRIVIERRVGEDGCYVVVTTRDADDQDGLEVFEILGMLEMAKLISSQFIIVEDDT